MSDCSMNTKKTPRPRELKTCEHCGKEVHLEQIDGRWCIDDPTCERHHWEADAPCRYQGKEGLIEWWNTRRRRTCQRVPGKMHYGERRPKCSECGYGLGDSRWAFCPKCGAEVIQ